MILLGLFLDVGLSTNSRTSFMGFPVFFTKSYISCCLSRAFIANSLA